MIVALPTSRWVTEKELDSDPAGIVTDGGTLIVGEEDDNETTVSPASTALIVAVSGRLAPVEQLLGGASDIPSGFTVRDNGAELLPLKFESPP